MMCTSKVLFGWSAYDEDSMAVTSDITTSGQMCIHAKAWVPKHQGGMVMTSDVRTVMSMPEKQYL